MCFTDLSNAIVLILFLFDVACTTGDRTFNCERQF